MTQKRLTSLAWIGVLLLAVAVFSFYFRGLMWSPNSHAPTFGGDGLTIHYNLQYHATYGDGAYLTNQYYPYEESIFMTDGQSLVAVVLAELRPLFPGIGGFAVGVSNFLIFWSNPLAVLLLFFIFRRLRVNIPVAALLALLIGMMAPQILRQIGGQYTLGYTFLLPLLIWYQLTFLPDRRYWWRSLLVATVIVLLGLNNPYLYAVAVAFLLACTGIGLLWWWFDKERIRARMLVHWSVVALASTVLVYFTLQYFDRVDDRVEVPFGFFHNVAQWGGLLTSPDSFAYRLVRNILPGLAEPRRENQLYLGLIPVVSVLVVVGLLLVPRTRGIIAKMDYTKLLILLGGAAAALVFAFGLPFSYFPDWTYEHLGAVLQFRAPVRFAWPLYYVLSIAAGYGLYTLYRNINNRTIGILVLAVPLLLWGLEAHRFLKGYVNIDHNALQPVRLKEVKETTQELGIDSASYSSIYLLPSEQGWSDKIHRDGSWRSNHDGYKYSLATGLPLLNGKLSRVSLSQTLASLQLISDPAIERTMLDHLDQDKDILLLVSLENELLPGEEGLRRNGELIFENGKIELRRLSLDAIRERHRAALDSLQTDSSTVTIASTDYEGGTEVAYSGQASRRIPAGWTEIERLPLDTTFAGDSLRLTLWNYADGSRFGGPTFYLRCLDAEGERLVEHKQWINASPDTDRGWLRATFDFRPPPGTAELELVGQYFHHYWIDELSLVALNKFSTASADSRPIEPASSQE